MVNENVTTNENNGTKTTKQYTNDDVMIILNAMPEMDRDILLNNFSFTSLKHFLSKDNYKTNMEAIDYNIAYYVLLKSAVKRLYIGINMTDTEENKVDTIMKLYNTLDDEKKIKVASKMRTGDNLRIALGKLRDTFKGTSSK